MIVELTDTTFLKFKDVLSGLTNASSKTENILKARWVYQ